VNCDAIPESFARVVGKLGISLSKRAHRENFWVKTGRNKTRAKKRADIALIHV
jgi:hypothetical protein